MGNVVIFAVQTPNTIKNYEKLFRTLSPLDSTPFLR